MTRLLREARILLVDDSANDVELTLDAFREARPMSHLDVACSGRQTLDRLLDRAPDPDGRRVPLPDLILLDLKLPAVDGFEVLRQVKAAPVLRRIPVVILTSSREEGDRALCYDRGANSYLVKPVSFEGMLQVVLKIADYWLTVNVGPPLPDYCGEAAA